MKVHKFDSREEWFAGRLGKITGSKLHGLVTKRGSGKKIGYYELIAEKLGALKDGENPADRGLRLESEALIRFEQETGKKVANDLVLWTRDDNSDIALSPDGVIGKKEAVEIKSLSSAHHIEAWLTKQVPSEYELQTLQYFCVSDELKTLYVAFYDPRIAVKDFFYLEIKREDVKEKVSEYLEYQKAVLDEVEKIVVELSF